jgi:SAM-dependent methyltransferase
MDYLKHFGEQSGDYCRFRPDYPIELYEYLAGILQERELAWDVGTGNGQAASKLSQFFKKVIATDLNQEQLKVAIKKDNIVYDACPADKTNIPNTSVNLITVAQALHWFPLNSFYEEVKRVSKSNGIIAVWCYPLAKITHEIDIIVKKLYDDILGDEYWPKERRYIDEAYRTIPFPFQAIEPTPPAFIIEKKYDFGQFLGYLNTWSAIKEYQKRNHKNPVDLIMEDLLNAWGEAKEQHIVRWALHLRVGRVNPITD